MNKLNCEFKQVLRRGFKSTPIISGGGGGGRPGGKPAFNWKVKRLLKIGDASAITYKAKSVGDFADLQKLFDPSRGDMMIDLNSVDEWEEPSIEYVSDDDNKSSRKTIQITRLFGPDKPSGSILRKCDRPGKRNYFMRSKKSEVKVSV